MSGDSDSDGKPKDDPLTTALTAAFYKAYADQPKFELPPFQCTSEAEYKLCLPPRKALARYELEPRLAMLQLNRELLADIVQAVALRALWNDIDKHGTLYYAVVPYWVWRTVSLKEDSDFWDTGFLETHFPSEPHNYRRWAQLFGVRFWPDGLPSLPDEGENGSEAARPNLPEADARHFCEFLLKGWPDITERTAHKRAVGFYSENKVPRDWFWEIFRAIRGPKNPGKQPQDRN